MGYRNAYNIFVESFKRGEHLGDLGKGGRIILKWLLGKQFVRVWTVVNWLRTDSNGTLI
jgi:hypothetical protein